MSQGCETKLLTLRSASSQSGRSSSPDASSAASSVSLESIADPILDQVANGFYC